jgi:cellulose synthase operon protein C
MTRTSRTGLLLAALLAAACASAPARLERADAGQGFGSGLSVETPRSAARAGFEALVRGDVARARDRFAAGARARDPWAHVGVALLARRDRLPADEIRALLAAVSTAPAHVLAPIALRRLEALAEEGGAHARAVAEGLAPLGAPGRPSTGSGQALVGLAAYRARVTRIRAAESRGDVAAVTRLRAENGSVDHWSLSGPWSAFHALDFDRPLAPETGAWPAAAPEAPGLPPRATRTIEAPDGTFALDGEPPQEDVFFLAADATLARGGRYLVSLGATGSARLFVDGATVAERNHFVAHAPILDQREVALAAGAHRLLVKVSRGATRGAVHVALARLDGTPSDATFAAAVPGSAPQAAPPAPARPMGRSGAMAAALAESAGSPVGAVLAALDVLPIDREAAKRLLDEAVARAPRLALARAARARAAFEDPTLDEGVARARAEADLRGALALDPGDVGVRAELAGLLAATGRLDDAEAALAEGPPAAAKGAGALVASARVANARGFTEAAGAHARAALAAGGGCDALLLVLDAAERREAVAERDGSARQLADCPGGRERLAEYFSARGDPRAALEAIAPVAEARPWSVEAGFTRAAAFVAAGEADRAVETLAALVAVWPRSARIAKRLADAHELAGDASAARRERERALALDPADLVLRRALALEDGTEVLAAFAEDARAAIRAYERSDVARDSSSAMVLDAAAIEIHPGGAATERIHQVIHVLDPSGVDEFGEVTIPADADVVAARTLKRDGRVLEPDAAAGGGKGTISLAGLEPGDYVELEYVRSVGPYGAREGYVADPFYFQVAGTSLFRSSYVVLAPRGLGLVVDAQGMEAPALEPMGDREVARAVRVEVPAFVPEPASPPLRELVPYLHVGVGGGRDFLAQVLADGTLERMRSTGELLRFAEEIRAQAGEGATPERLARAAHDAVARRVRGTGAGLLEDASVILSRGRGGRVGVLAAVLGELGFESRLVVVKPFTSDPRPRRFPGAAEYTHFLVRARKGGETFWLDVGQRLAPFGALHPAVLDAEALVIGRPGEALEAIRTPAKARVEELRTVQLDLQLAPDGSAEVRGVDRYEGWAAGAVRGELEQLEPAERARSVEGMLARTFRGLAVESVDVDGEDDAEAPLVIRWRGRVPGLARVAGDALVLDAPIHPARLSGRFVRVASRRTPLLLGQDERVAQTVRITPPPGFTSRAGDRVELDGALGTFARAERVEENRLVREERLALKRGRYAPDAYPAVASFAAAVDEVQERPVAFTRAR